MDDWTEKATLSVTEVAILLGVSRSKAYEACRVGELPTLRLGRRILVPVEGLKRLLGGPDVGQ